MTGIVLTLGGFVVRGVLPYPDLARRIRVRRSAYALATHDPWPNSESEFTDLGYARLALLRLLRLQHDTRRVVQMRQHEAAAQLARTAVETCILGLWCLYTPNARDKIRGDELKAAPSLLAFLSHVEMIPDAVIRQAVSALGQPEKLPDVRSMTAQIDSKTGAKLAIVLYDMVYRPASHFFTHATNSALQRHVRADLRYARRPAKVWVRRTPVRLADACVGLLAGAIANSVAAPAELFRQYAMDHAARVLPPVLAAAGKGVVRTLGLGDLLVTLREAREVKAYLSQDGPSIARDERETRLRSMYDGMIARLDIGDVSPAALQPIIDHLVLTTLDSWDAEYADRLGQQSAGGEPQEA
ncbi:hypothetical protein ACPPVO_35940 [Dactylosporangium sp. McL0621]|uniref:hypothetical protein n=1 Tax=Dactylosporangium sp. McL0621 TaxID=3415678 RepID=UPI003CE6B107